jgi:hypothetical protein
MTYAPDIEPEYPTVRSEIAESLATFVLLPSLDREVCVTEAVRRQIGRPFGRSAIREEAVIRARFEIYMAVPARKIETMRPVAAAVDEIIASLRPKEATMAYSGHSTCIGWPAMSESNGTATGICERLERQVYWRSLLDQPGPPLVPARPRSRRSISRTRAVTE